MNKFEKCQVIMLPANRAFKDGDLILNTRRSTLFIAAKGLKEGWEGYDSSHLTPQYLYILSNDKIKENDWYIRTGEGTNTRVFRANTKPLNYLDPRIQSYKIIATTNPELNLLGIPTAFIHSYCVSSGSITEVMVEYEHQYRNSRFDWSPTIPQDQLGNTIMRCSKPKTMEGCIFIREVKQTFTRSEVEALLLKYDADLHGGLTNTTSLNAWINKNL